MISRAIWCTEARVNFSKTDRLYLITFVNIVIFNGLSKEIPIFGGVLFLETLCILVFLNFLLTPTDN